MNFTKPKKLQKGDTVGIVSPSWGGPGTFPHVYESGIRALENLGLLIKEFPSARKDADFLYNNPEFRAQDISAAFVDTEVKAIFASIGGEDSVRILPFLDIAVIQANPKMLMGFSDTTTLTTYLNQLGLVTFNGPSIMAGFSQWDALPETFHKHIQDFFFGTIEQTNYPVYEAYANGYLDWSDENNVGKIKEMFKNDGPHWLQGTAVAHGELFGGCIEVLEFMKATDFWPTKDFWNGKILFLETSEEKPGIEQVRWMLRNYGMQGIFNQISGLLFARARDYSDAEKKELDETIVQVVAGEFKNSTMPIVSNMDFGHTDPQFILPLGIKAEVDPIKKTFQLLESPFQ